MVGCCKRAPFAQLSFASGKVRLTSRTNGEFAGVLAYVHLFSQAHFLLLQYVQIRPASDHSTLDFIGTHLANFCFKLTAV